MRLTRIQLFCTLVMILSAGLVSATASADSFPTGERIHGQAAVEPAYNSTDGSLVYLLTPVKAPAPARKNSRAVGELLLVEYPPSTSFDVPFNCEGVPGNCPDHAGPVAAVATANQPDVYGTDPSVVPGHDHLIAPPGTSGDFSVALEVVEVLFTSKAVDAHAITHLTTKAEVDAAVANGYAIKIDLGFALHGSVVSRAAYLAGRPV